MGSGDEGHRMNQGQQGKQANKKPLLASSALVQVTFNEISRVGCCCGLLGLTCIEIASVVGGDEIGNLILMPTIFV